MAVLFSLCVNGNKKPPISGWFNFLILLSSFNLVRSKAASANVDSFCAAVNFNSNAVNI